MNSFNADYLGIEPHELVRYLLRESGQQEHEAININDIIELLKLRYVKFPFNQGFSSDIYPRAEKPRALLSFHDKLVASDEELSPNRDRFSVLHEIGHYVLPSHQYEFYLCDDKGLSLSTHSRFENEANDFAADLLFMGDRFTLEANSQAFCAATVKQMAEKYQASFEATARRLVEKNFRPCMLVSFKRKQGQMSIENKTTKDWEVRYCAASAPFRSRYFTGIRGEIPEGIVSQLLQPSRDIAASIKQEVSISTLGGESIKFQAEYFYNKYHIFAILIPLQ